MARPRKFEEATVIKAAREQFWSAGYSGTSLDDLERVTSLGRGSLYNSFGDKHTLYVRTFEDYCRDIVKATANALDGPDHEAAGRLRGLLHGLTEAYGRSAGAGPRACFLAKATAEMAALDEEVAERARRAFADLESLLANAVAAAQRAGDMTSALEPRAIARHLLATMRGVEALAQAGVEEEMLRDAVASLLAVLMLDTPVTA